MLQDSWLFSGTVQENIQTFNEYDDEHILKICNIAVDDFIGSNPKGQNLNKRARDWAFRWTAANHQSYRSLLHDPQFTGRTYSSMDQGTEKKVVELPWNKADKSMLIVTHRNPILSIVDRVFVLENGKIVADQTPEQLGIKKLIK